MPDRMQVIVTLESKQGSETTRHQYPGEWFRKDRSVYLRYEEGQDGEAVRTIIRCRPDEMLITRRGAVESDQLFVRDGGRQPGSYRSPYTSFQMETDTKKLSVRAGGGRDDADMAPPFTIEWKYEIWVNGEISGRFHNRLQVTQAEQPEA
ncbi:DUF1934 domain-containing protein [Paenibacillus gorillae]|uniref:DUF1934 domain-containing protein n=1 Tax=Paenibacillus gorillae TaxID=1243662 RepID=UPI0004BA08DF|nr:DUF1934 domain-containing protein [Paenibacillus gorillae]